MGYTLDANILINMENRYPKEFFKTLWDKMEHAAVSNNVCVCQVILTEIERGDRKTQKEELGVSSWIKNINGFVCEENIDEFKTVGEISQAHPGWVQEMVNYGDPFIIAHAKHSNRVIVTEESRKGPGTIDKNQKIPNIADEHNVQCINFFEFMRREKWTF